VATPSLAAIKSAFSNRNYAVYTAGNWLSLLGFWMQRLAVSWLTWELSHSEFWVGAVAFAEIVPLIVVGPLFGVWADRLDRRKIAMALQAAMLLQALTLFVALRLGWLGIGWLFTLTLIEGSLQAAYQPVRLALIPTLVRRSDLVAAAAFTAVTFNVARFLGPAIAGVVIAWSSPAWAILFNAVSYLCIIGAWWLIDLPEETGQRAPSRGLGRDLWSGVIYVWREPALALLFGVLMLLALFARPVTYLLSAFVGTLYDGGPQALAMLTAAVGVGAVLAGLQLSLQGETRGLVRAILCNSLLTLVSLLAFAYCTDLWLGALLMLLFGYSVTVAAVAGQTLVQHSVEDQSRGRVLSLWVAATRGPPALGVLLLGSLATWWGLSLPFLLATGLCLIGLLLLWRGQAVMREHFEEQPTARS